MKNRGAGLYMMNNSALQEIESSSLRITVPLYPLIQPQWFLTLRLQFLPVFVDSYLETLLYQRNPSSFHVKHKSHLCPKFHQFTYVYKRKPDVLFSEFLHSYLFFNSKWKYLYCLQSAYKGCKSSHEQHCTYYTQHIVDKELYEP